MTEVTLFEIPHQDALTVDLVVHKLGIIWCDKTIDSSFNVEYQAQLHEAYPLEEFDIKCTIDTDDIFKSTSLN